MAFHVVGVHGLVMAHGAQRIGQLDLSVKAVWREFQVIKDVRRNDIAPKDGLMAGGIFSNRFFRDVMDADEVGMSFIPFT